MASPITARKFDLGGQPIGIWGLMVISIAILSPLGFKWVRAFHLFFGFAWWGMLLFLNIVLLPGMKQMSKAARYEVLGWVFPRIFRTATVVGFMAVVFGWILALHYIANWNLSYFWKSTLNIIFLFGLVVITLLYCFHLFLERNEIETVQKAMTRENDKEVNKLLNHLELIPRIGLTILTLGALLMFIH